MKLEFCIVPSVLFALSAPAMAQTGKTTVSSTTSTFYSPNTAAYAQAVAWLKEHSFDDQRQLLGDFDKLGALKVVYHTASGSNAAADIPGPPVPLPTTGNKGDTITVSTCGGGWSQAWSYAWVRVGVDNGLGLASYSKTRVTSCSSNGA
jgi:hypothetical protein